MAIRHKYDPPIDDGPNDGRIQPSHWRDAHDAGPLLDALSELDVAGRKLVYLNADGVPQLISLSDFAKSALNAANGGDMATLLGVAPLDSPSFFGNVLVPTVAGTAENSTRAASTAFVQAVRALLAPLNSPGFTGTPLAPTALPGTNTTQIASTAFVAAAIAALVNSSPSTLDTLKELADALGDDPNFATTMATALGLRLRVDVAQSLSAGQKAQLAANGGLPRIIRVRKFIASGPYVPDANLIFARGRAQGAGGGGGGTAVSAAGYLYCGGGGGSGSCSTKILLPADIGASLAITIGTAGTAAPASDTAGGNGGDTSIGGLCIGKGGGGGAAASTRLSGIGGVPGTGDSTRPGRNGSPAQVINGSASIGNGADSDFGTGGRGAGLSGAGGAATGYGAGGAGGGSYNAGAAVGGGAGSPGYVEIEEYCSA